MSLPITMKLVYPEIDFSLQTKLHPRHQDLKNDFIRWMVETYNVQDSKRLDKDATVAMHFGRLFAKFEYSDRLLLVNRLIALWFLIDDIVDERKTSTEDANSVNTDFLASIRNFEHQTNNKYIAAHMEVMFAIKSKSPEHWFIRFQEAVYQCFYYNHLSATEDARNVQFPKVQVVRIISCGAQGTFYLYEFLADSFLSPRVLLSPYFQNLECLAVRMCGFYNDIVSFEKEVVQNPNYLVIVALKRKLQSNYQAAINELARMIEDDLNAFHALAVECVHLFNEEDSIRLQLYIGHVLTGLQGNKEFSEDTGRYPRGKEGFCESI